MVNFIFRNVYVLNVHNMTRFASQAINISEGQGEGLGTIQISMENIPVSKESILQVSMFNFS